ncbi:uncharacterized protein LOC115890359 isoform X1 [Sitophilus oryzae]|uniref:Uncharacterized protein LOC115890359 isoform X1 n=2 Tax=Sitophilus oryzae TaxID=7048 RepID=A0A6J2YQU2_SITOR|nr:uncharacterized protein LOC115890359 isoform X1 [Sitophilus oryzae]
MDAFSAEEQVKLKEIIQKQRIPNYSVEVKKVMEDGDGYLGVLTGLNILDTEGNKKLSFAIKTAPKSKKLREMFPTRNTFLREIYVYETLFPEFQNFQEQYHISKPFNSTPKYYGSSSEDLNEMIVLENLKESKYKLHTRREPMDSHHLSLVMAEYARLHAVSLAMRKLDPEKFKELSDKVKLNVLMEHEMKKDRPIDQVFSDKKANVMFEPVFEVLKGREKELEAVEKFSKDGMKLFFESYTEDSGLKVISHSDCWSANMLFKYEDESYPTIPTKVCLIDWQLASLAPPIFDISYFFYICAGKKDLNNYMRFLNVYHTVLGDSLKDFGLDIEEIYPYDRFESDWRKLSKMGYFMTIVMLMQCLSETKTHNFEEMADKGQDIYDMNQRKQEISDVYRQRMGDLVEFLVKNQLL